VTEKNKLKFKRIHRDSRGDIYAIYAGSREYILLVTKKGSRRGGDYHQSIQHDTVLDGRVKVVSLKKELMLQEGQTVTFGPNEPHYIEATSDCLILEWLEGSFEKKYFKPYRDLIEEKMK